MEFNASFFWTLASFAGLLMLLARFVLKPLQAMLDKRQEELRRALDEARQNRLEADRSAERSEARLQQARQDAEQIIAEGQHIVERMERDAQARADEDAQAIVAAARDEIQRESEKALTDLRSTVSNLSVRISRQVVRGRMDDEVHDQLVDDFVKHLKGEQGVN